MKIFLMAMMALNCFALPVMSPDSISVDQNDPRIGQHVYAYPMSSWRIWGNDNPVNSHGNDFDYNDAVADVFFNVDGSGLAVWVGSNSAWVNSFTIQGQLVNALSSASWGPLVLGSQLNVVMNTQYGPSYATGTRNILTDGRYSPVPEPSMFIMIGVGLVALSALKRKAVE